MRGLLRSSARAANRQLAEARYVAGLRALPPGVARFHWRARRLARRTGDSFSLASATRPADLAVLLGLPGERRRVVELGTGTAWTTLALALADCQREVISYDPVYRPQRERYLTLAGPQVSARIRFHTAAGCDGPGDCGPVDLLYIDSSHRHEETVTEFFAWRPALRAGALVVFDDYTHPDYPGVRSAVRELGLRGTSLGTLFVHEAPPGART